MKSKLLQQALEQITNQTAGIVELSDETLENVSGGYDTIPLPVTPIVSPDQIAIPAGYAPDPYLRALTDRAIEKANIQLNRNLQ